MPSLEKHLENSLTRTGRDYREVHEWIDHPDYKFERHDLTRILEFGRMFERDHGPEAAQEYLHPLVDDVQARFHHLVDDVEAALDKTLAYFGAARHASGGKENPS